MCGISFSTCEQAMFYVSGSIVEEGGSSLGVFGTHADADFVAGAVGFSQRRFLWVKRHIIAEECC